MAVLVVEQGAGVAVGAATLVAHVWLRGLAAAPVTATFGQPAGLKSLLLHQGEVQARPPAQLLGAPWLWLLGSGLTGQRRLSMADLHVESEAGVSRKGSLTGPAGQLPLLLVNAPVVVELGGHAKGLSTVVAAVAPYLRVNTAMVLQGEEVGVGLETDGTVVDANRVCVLVVEERTGVAVGAATLITPVQRQTIKKVRGQR